MAFDGFIKFDGIEGECKEIGHQGWIDTDGFSCGFLVDALPGPSGELEAGIPELMCFEFRQYISRASVPLFMCCAQGRPLPKAQVDVCVGLGQNKHVLLRMEFEDCFVSSFELKTDGDQITEVIEVTFGKMQWTYTEQPATVSVATR